MTSEEFKKRLNEIINEAIIAERFDETGWKSEGSEEADEVYDKEWVSKGRKEKNFLELLGKSTNDLTEITPELARELKRRAQRKRKKRHARIVAKANAAGGGGGGGPSDCKLVIKITDKASLESEDGLVMEIPAGSPFEGFKKMMKFKDYSKNDMITQVCKANNIDAEQYLNSDYIVTMALMRSGQAKPITSGYFDWNGFSFDGE